MIYSLFLGEPGLFLLQAGALLLVVVEVAAKGVTRAAAKQYLYKIAASGVIRTASDQYLLFVKGSCSGGDKRR